MSMPAGVTVVVDKKSECIFAQTGPRELDRRLQGETMTRSNSQWF